MKATYILLWGLMACMVTVPTFAQETKKPDAHQEMDVDLPDETEETSIVDPGQCQIESAILYNHYNDAPESWIGQLLLRYGVSKRLELRALIEDGRGRDRYMEETVQSTYPLALSAKYVVLKDHKVLPDITLVGYLKLPFTGRSHEQNAYWSPILLAAFQHKWGKDRWKLEYNAGVQQEAYSSEWVWLANASLHYKVLESMEIFGEYYAQFQPGEDPQHNAGGGIAWQIGNSLEVYGVAGSSVNYEKYNLFAATGLAVRF